MIFKSSLLVPKYAYYFNIGSGKTAGKTDRNTFLLALKTMNDVLAKKGEKLTLLMVGGGALMLVQGFREETEDLDVTPYPMNPKNLDLFTDTRNETTSVLKKHGINLVDSWINVDVAWHFVDIGIKKDHYQADPRYSWSNLTVLFAKPEFLLALKCQAQRTDKDKSELDKKDIRNLLHLLGIKTLTQLYDVIEQYIDIDILDNLFENEIKKLM